MLSLIKNILFPTDFSDVANNAMNVAVAMAKRQSAKLHILHVVVPQYMSVIGDVSLPIAYDGWDEIEKLIKENLENLAVSLSNTHSIEIISHTNVGYVTESIEKKSTEIQADIIVMGTHGSSGIRDFFIGSNAYSTIKNVDCPVLTIPAQFTSTEFTHVLFPVRNVEGVDDKYRSITQILKANHSKVELMGLSHFQDLKTYNLITDKVEELKRTMKADGVEVIYSSEFCENFAVHVLEYAYEVKPDLLVINAIIDADWRRYFMGSYAQKIVNNATCPVLSIKPKVTKLELEGAINVRLIEAKKEIPEKLLLPQIGLMSGYQHDTSNTMAVVV